MKRKKNYWLLALFGAIAMLFAWTGTVDARGRGGRGPGGGGGGRGGRGGRGSRGGRGGSGGRNNSRRSEQQRERRAERLSRVEAARIAYAKRERQEMWDAEASKRIDAAIKRVLGSAE